jgi:hypothetical protein
LSLYFIVYYPCIADLAVVFFRGYPSFRHGA